MRSCSEQPCHGTCVVLKATIAQKRLAGNAVCSVHSRITSASMRNITRPRNASIEVTRAARAGATCCCGRVVVTAEATAFMVKAFYCVVGIAGGDEIVLTAQVRRKGGHA